MLTRTSPALSRIRIFVIYHYPLSPRQKITNYVLISAVTHWYWYLVCNIRPLTEGLQPTLLRYYTSIYLYHVRTLTHWVCFVYVLLPCSRYNNWSNSKWCKIAQSPHSTQWTFTGRLLSRNTKLLLSILSCPWCKIITCQRRVMW